MKAIVVLIVLTTLFVTFAYGVGTLYGLSPIVARLVKINPQNAAVSPVGRHDYPKELTAQQISTIDIQRKIYYMIAYNETDSSPYIVGLSLKSGVLVSNVKLPYAESAFVGVGQYIAVIPKTGEVLTLGKDRVRQRYHVLKTNVVSGIHTVIGSISLTIPVLGGAAAYDPDQDLFWFQFGTSGAINNFGFSVTEKKLVFNVTDNQNLETMDWDEKTGTIRGIGLSPAGERVLLSLDPKNGKTQVIGKIPDYFIIEASLAALDERNRILYSYLQPNTPKNAPFHLVAVNLDNAKIISDPPVLGSQSAIPWSIAFDYTL